MYALHRIATIRHTLLSTCSNKTSSCMTTSTTTPIQHNSKCCFHTTSASSSSSTSNTTTSIFHYVTYKEIQYALGGWIFFVIENIVLSENRSYLIPLLNSFNNTTTTTNTNDNDDIESNYRLVYGTFSTIASLSILYGYRQLRLLVPAQQQLLRPLHRTYQIAAISFIGFGLALVSQSIPKIQIPFELSLSSKQDTTSSTTSPPTTTTISSSSSNVSTTSDESIPSSFKFKVRCPFDFTDQKQQKQSNNPTIQNDENVTGIDRITRHPGLWSFGCICLGHAFLQPSYALSLFMIGPIFVSFIGGYHYDLRLQRHMGGSFPSITYEQQTSNIPFLAMILGQQQEQSFIQSFYTYITKECKILNAALAFVVATVYVSSRGRYIIPPKTLSMTNATNTATKSSMTNITKSSPIG